MATEQKKYIFIGGLHRSGTTPFARCLAQHPEMSAFHDTNVPEDEGQFLQTVYPTDNAFGGPGRFAFDEKAHLTESSELLTAENKAKLISEWEAQWDMSKKAFLDKSPPTLIQSRFMQAVFPNSYFIYILRHPIATSLATYKWSGTGIYSLINHWVDAHQLMLEDIPYLKNCMVIRYEDFVTKPSAVLEDVENFLGIHHHKYSTNMSPGFNEKYFKKWVEVFLQDKNREKPVPSAVAVHAHKIPFWKRSIKREFKRYVRNKLFGEVRQLSHTVFESQDAVSVFEKKINKYGYSLLDPKQLSSMPDFIKNEPSK